MLAVAFAAMAVPALAQTSPSDPATAQAVGLFVQSCIPFTGDKVGLRNWIAARHLPQLSAVQAAPFLGPLGSGEVFAASNTTGEYALISYDIGACKVEGEGGDMQAAQNMLSAYLAKNGFAQTAMTGHKGPDAAMQLYRVTRGGHAWLVSVMRHDHSDAPDMPSELDLLATPEAGKTP
jgi:hypothetical protein